MHFGTQGWKKMLRHFFLEPAKERVGGATPSQHPRGGSDPPGAPTSKMKCFRCNPGGSKNHSWVWFGLKIRLILPSSFYPTVVCGLGIVHPRSPGGATAGRMADLVLHGHHGHVHLLQPHRDDVRLRVRRQLQPLLEPLRGLAAGRRGAVCRAGDE